MIQKEFKNDGSDFSALYFARDWLDKNGYSYGSLSGPLLPVGIMRGKCAIAKWKNLTSIEIKELDGIMSSTSWRNGNVVIEIK